MYEVFLLEVMISNIIYNYIIVWKTNNHVINSHIDQTIWKIYKIHSFAKDEESET